MNARSGRIPVIKTLLVLCVLAGAILLGQNLSRRANPGSVVVPQATVESWQQLQPTYQAQTFSIPSNYPLDGQPRLSDQPQPTDIAQQSGNFNSNAHQPLVAEDNWNRAGSPISPQYNPYATPPNPQRPNLPGTPPYPPQLSSAGVTSQLNQPPSGWSDSVPSEWAQPRYPVRVNGDEPLPPEAQNLLQELRAQPPGSRDEKKLAALREAIEKKFQAKHEGHVKRLEKLQAEMDKAQQILDRRQKQRDEIIDRRVAELLGQSDPLGWNYYVDAGVISVPAFSTQNYDPNQYPPSMPKLQSEVGPYSAPDSNRRVYVPDSPIPGVPSTRASPAPAPPKASQQLAPPRLPATTAGTEPTATPASGTSNGVIALAYRWKGLKEQFELAEPKHEQGLLGQSEFAKIKNDLAAIEAQWQQQHRELEREVQIKLLALEDTKLEVETAESNVEHEQVRSAKLRGKGEISSNLRSFELKREQARNAVRRAELELETVMEQQAWANDFAKQLEPKPDDSSKDKKREPGNEFIPPAIEPFPISPAPVAKEPVEISEPNEPTVPVNPLNPTASLTPSAPAAPSAPNAPAAPSAPAAPTSKPVDSSERP